MTVDVDTLMQIVGVLLTLGGALWYVAGSLHRLKGDIVAVEKTAEHMTGSVKSNTTEQRDTAAQCRDGRILIWEEVHALKTAVVRLETRLDAIPKDKDHQC
jgi:ubiquinone biosynthesis protein UbiJ